MAGNMSSMPGGRRCRFEPEQEDLYGSQEEAQIVYALKEGHTVVASSSDANAETVDPVESTDTSPKKPGLGRSDTGPGSPEEDEGK